MRTVCWIPGPDPTECGNCGDAMSPPHYGRNSGLWVRTCKGCRESTFTKQTPAHVERASGPVGAPLQDAELPFETWRPPSTLEPMRRVAQAVKPQLDARMRQTGEVA